jgi:hypothetical protein
VCAKVCVRKGVSACAKVCVQRCACAQDRPALPFLSALQINEAALQAAVRACVFVRARASACARVSGPVGCV